MKRKFAKNTFVGEYYFSEENILSMANSDIPQEVKDHYGDMILNGLGYNGYCEHFGRCKENGFVNIGWSNDYCECYMKTFSVRELADKLKNKTYHVEMEVSI